MSQEEPGAVSCREFGEETKPLWFQSRDFSSWLEEMLLNATADISDEKRYTADEVAEYLGIDSADDRD